jgi:nickel-dependent lactate racemase
MRITLHYGRRHLDLDRPDDRPVLTLPSPAPLADPAGAVREAVENPFDFPALRRALTPDDQVSVVIDPQLPHPLELLPPLLEPILAAGVAPEAITLLCPPGDDLLGAGPTWLRQLPEPYPDIRVEVLDPDDRSKLAYLATTAAGRRIYLNRTLVDSAQSVVLSTRHYDPLLGYAGAEGDIYPQLSDRETLQSVAGHVRFMPPQADDLWPTLREAIEVAWLIGQPFYVQLIPGPGDSVAQVVAGAGEAGAEGRRRLDACWRHTVPGPFDLVIATLRGDPSRHTFADLAAAVATAARVVRSGGRIVLLTEAAPRTSPGFEVLQQEDDPRDALKTLLHKPTVERAPAIRWTEAACHARLAVLSGLSADLVEELYAAPLTGSADLQRLVAGSGSCLVLEDAHQRIVTVA